MKEKGISSINQFLDNSIHSFAIQIYDNPFYINLQKTIYDLSVLVKSIDVVLDSVSDTIGLRNCRSTIIFSENGRRF